MRQAAGRAAAGPRGLRRGRLPVVAADAEHGNSGRRGVGVAVPREVSRGGGGSPPDLQGVQRIKITKERHQVAEQGDLAEGGRRALRALRHLVGALRAAAHRRGGPAARRDGRGPPEEPHGRGAAAGRDRGGRPGHGGPGRPQARRRPGEVERVGQRVRCSRGFCAGCSGRFAPRWPAEPPCTCSLRIRCRLVCRPATGSPQPFKH
mmetsp:Transcript_121045/g.324941  ORF Transcript_121045/g.324941 Transcript_121045/m.324941 type:complete len:206 (+) Transcript_121045:1409-2026(+)